ncbi:unnamed protein product [Caenorhabditis sp. 36 PRJEB53466]|nr:unnamed protein product [Caenorhabditis sp. 36 PRJEB53466]
MPRNEQVLSGDQIHEAAENLLAETAEFIEFMVEFGRPNVKVPQFFVIAFNYLRRQAAQLGIREPLLESLPAAVEMILVAEAGTPLAGTLPFADADGMLVEPSSDGTVLSDAVGLMADVVEYCRNCARMSGRLPLLPFGYILSLLSLQETYLVDRNSHDYRIVDSIPDTLQGYLARTLGNLVPPGYVRGAVPP